MNPESPTPPPDQARPGRHRAAVGRRRFIAGAVLATAGLAGIPIVKGINRWADRPEPGGQPTWDPGMIPGLDLHFDARRMTVHPLDSTDFTAPQPWTSARGMTWSRTNRLQATT